MHLCTEDVPGAMQFLGECPHCHLLCMTPLAPLCVPLFLAAHRRWNSPACQFLLTFVWCSFVLNIRNFTFLVLLLPYTSSFYIYFFIFKSKWCNSSSTVKIDLHFSKLTSELNTFATHNMCLSNHNSVCCEYSQYFTVFYEGERDTETCIKWEEKI